MLRIARAVRAIKQQQAPERRPQTPYVTVRTPASITIEWVLAEGVESNPDHYFTSVLQICEPDTLRWKTVYRGFSSKFCVSELRPGTLYKVRLRVDSSVGQGTWSEPVTAQTRDEIPSIQSLHRAIQYGYTQEVTKILQLRPISAAMTYSPEGLTATQQAVLQGDRRMVELVMAGTSGCHVDTPSVGGAARTALMLACGAGHSELVHLLVERGASWHVRDRNGLTALHYATDASQLEAVQIALSNAADVKAEDCSGWTPLMRGVLLHSNEDVLQELVTAGADVNHRDKDGLSCLAAAVMCARTAVIKMLLQNGADANMAGDSQDNSALKIAEELENEELMSILSPPVSAITCSPAVHVNVDSDEEIDTN